MSDMGNYQNEITNLQSLDIGDYENIFKIFELSVNNKNFFTYNILKKIEFPELDYKYLGFYTPKSKMALTILSYNIYEDIKSWWILYLLNKDKFDGAPFYIDGGVEIKYILPEIRTLIYDDIVNSTIYGGRHY